MPTTGSPEGWTSSATRALCHWNDSSISQQRQKGNPMLRIHGSARSSTQRTLLMVLEPGVPLEHDALLPRSPGTKTPEFLALNPNSRVPVIEDDGFVLTESMAINLYLAKKHKSPLYPS